MTRRFAVAAALLTCAVAALAGSASATPARASACNLRGSWVAGTAEANAFFRAINPTASDIKVVSGALSTTFTRRTMGYGGLGITLELKLGQSQLKEVVDIESVSPYTVRGNTLVLGKGSYKLTVHSAKLKTRSGAVVNVPVPNQAIETPGTSVAYSCTPSMLRWRVPLPRPPGTTLTFHRA